MLLILPSMLATTLTLQSVPPVLARANSAAFRMVATTTPTMQPLFSFSADTAQEAISAWERIDDVIMGGVSNSRLAAAPNGECAYFEGRLRELGGGFCGQRMRLLSEPLDLSSQAGIYLDCEADADAPRRAFKVALRTKQDRGEVVYQAQFVPPPLERSTVFLPFDAFKLVRGPRLVPGVPPLSAEATNATYQMSIIVSKFLISADGAAIDNFKEGRFRLKLFSVGTFAADAAPPSSIMVPNPMSEQEQAASKPVLIKLLGPLLSLLFGETRRRRRAATTLLQTRGTSRVARVRLAWALRRAGGRVSPLTAAMRTLRVGLQDVVALALSLPARLLAGAVFKTLRLVRKLQGGAPKMPPLRSA
jgi:hypothetical protein